MISVKNTPNCIKDRQSYFSKNKKGIIVFIKDMKLLGNIFNKKLLTWF